MGTVGDFAGLRVYESDLVPYGKAYLCSKAGYVVISTAPKPTRWHRFWIWLRRMTRRRSCSS